MNIWDILILLLILGATALAFRTLRRKKNNGGCSCGCSVCIKKCPAWQEEKAKTNS